ncbi:PRC-barrel domain-containing protein [Moorella naiadis]|uniref:PRC-barrel domain-containing protein n=1 Tax=Moorella naiadis (nom. illeg.) TaxID=3093670 RepID=UPI003D9CBA01
MPKGREVVGLPVISRDRGEELGRIQDLYFDESGGNLKAILLADGGWLRQPRVVDFSRLEARGTDAFMVSDAGTVVHEPPPGTRRWQELKGLRLINSAGQELGLVEDLVIELPSGQVKALEVSTGLVNDLLDGRKELPLTGPVNWGEDTVIMA